MRINSSRPLETVLELHNSALPRAIEARELRGAGHGDAALQIGYSDDDVTGLDVTVPDSHAPGVHDILLLDPAGDVPLGVLRLTVR